MFDMMDGTGFTSLLIDLHSTGKQMENKLLPGNQREIYIFLNNLKKTNGKHALKYGQQNPWYIILSAIGIFLFYFVRLLTVCISRCLNVTLATNLHTPSFDVFSSII